ncbi:hypothetical protein H0H81_000326 [Sphagnurus paluster]|uniref:DNA polymerase kappa n=1 Tax=Sphagnurus paluster TaxID=117069 RepID=A0A9P7KFE5_9AGAR|nr:hypothetical protein H0H81_000326 [Sphagnurus paluster]
MAEASAELILSQETESLVKRLAGPSTGKAGWYDGFQQNEKKRDKDLTRRIELILKQREEVLHGVDIATIEQSADRLLDELESQRDLSQIIVHVDMDAFFANVELLDDPTLEGKAFAVGHTVLTTASYEARKYGVRSGMAGFIAKKLCPELIFVPIHPSRYSETSKAVMSIFKEYDSNLFAAGCDEAYLNITPYCTIHNLTAADCVQEMRKKVFQETKLTASAGIAPTKNKPNGQFELSFDKESVMLFLQDLSIRKVPGIGRVNERLLESIGIKTCGDIFTHRATIHLMEKQFGREYLFRTYLGITSNVVKPIERGERKSIGAERTFSPLREKGKILQKLEEIALELEKDMEENGWAGQTVNLKFKLENYQSCTRAKSYDRWITTKEDLYTAGKELILPEFPLSIRLIGLRVTKLKDLQANSEPVNGIKRFFEPLVSEQPWKKVKMEDGNKESLVYNQIDNDGFHGFMPGFHEQEDTSDLDQNKEIIPIPKPQAKPRPPLSALAASVHMNDRIQHGASSSTSGHVKPRSLGHVTKRKSSGAASFTDLDPTETHDCPICGKALRTDNQGLNAHIDFCLSRTAIRVAHAEATGHSKDDLSRFKPISKGKGNK